jgi:hypothetical protein
LAEGRSVPFPECALSSITSFVAFELAIEKPEVVRRFVLNLPISGVPTGRKAAVIQTVIANREGFLRYLMFLLAGMGEGSEPVPPTSTEEGGAATYSFRDDFPLLEELTRALSADPKRLVEIKRLVSDLSSPEEGLGVIPEGFHSIWRVFEPFCEEASREPRD